MHHRRFAFAAVLVLALAACGGTNSGPPPFVPTAAPTATPAPQTATVSFLVVVPAAQPVTRRRRNVVVPSSATSVTFTLDSVNGTAYTGTPTTETLSSSNSACESVNGQLSCSFNLPSPVGALIYTITVYDGTTVLGEGNVAVTTTNGSTVNAPFTLTGTVAKIAITPGSAVTGIANPTVPLTVQAEDANGDTILGTFSTPITLTDNDTSGATKIATSGSDNPPAGELVSSADTATLAYNGATLSTGATIGATAGSVTASATFQPLAGTYLTQSGTVTFGVTTESNTSNYDVVATASPNPVTTSYPIAVATGATFGSASNLIEVTGLSEAPNQPIPLSSSAAVYYAWTPTNTGATLGLVGYSDAANTYVADYDQLDDATSSSQSLVETCAAPYQELVARPLTNWNVASGSGTCTTVFNDGYGDSDTYAYSGNGSYTDTVSLTSNGSDWDFCPCMSGTTSVAVDASGDLTYSIGAYSEGNTSEPYGIGGLSVPAPTSASATIPVTWNIDETNYGSIVPTPAPTSAANPWLAVGVTSGTIPSPLFSDTETYKGSESLPSACAVPSSITGSNTVYEEVESIVQADPMGTWLPFYSTTTVDHYYIDGVGEVCNEVVSTEDWFAAWGTPGANNYEYNDGPPVWSFGSNLSGALGWYAGSDANFSSYYSDTYTYLTSASILQSAARTRSITQALPAASNMLTATTYAIVRARLARPHLSRRHSVPSSYVWPGGKR
jgi:hypothetical protein